MHLAAAALTAIVVMLSLFYHRKTAAAAVMLFVGYTVVFMLAYLYFVNPLNYNNSSRTFSIAAGKLIPAADNLVAYNYISARSIQYIGRKIPKETDLALLSEFYEQGGWIITTGKHFDQLLSDGRFELVFSQEKAERHGNKFVSGGLFHKSDD